MKRISVYNEKLDRVLIMEEKFCDKCNKRIGYDEISENKEYISLCMKCAKILTESNQLKQFELLKENRK